MVLGVISRDNRGQPSERLTNKVYIPGSTRRPLYRADLKASNRGRLLQGIANTGESRRKMLTNRFTYAIISIVNGENHLEFPLIRQRGR